MGRGVPATEDDVKKVVDYIRLKLGGLGDPLSAVAYEYASLGQCVIDAVYSLGAHYSSTARTVKEWSDRYGWELRRDAGVRERTIEEFLAILEPYKGRWDEMAKVVFDNSQRTSSKSGIRKAEAVYHFAEVLRKFGINTRGDVLKLHGLDDLRQQVGDIRGQASGLSFKYCLMLAGRKDLVKSDRMIRRFIAKAIGVSRVSAKLAERLVIEASGRLGSDFPMLSPSVLDNKIWDHERRQGGQSATSRSRGCTSCRASELAHDNLARLSA